MSMGLFADFEREKKEFVYDLSLATQGVMVSQYNTGVNYSLGIAVSYTHLTLPTTPYV